MKTPRACFRIMLFVCLLLLGCGSLQYPVQVRVANIANHLGPVRVLVDGFVVADRVVESSISDYVVLPSDIQAKIEVQSAGSHTTLFKINE